jgi:hypothetical protein
MTTDLPDEEALRKAWLKQKFGSFEYREELVRLHEKWREVLRNALQLAEAEPFGEGAEAAVAEIQLGRLAVNEILTKKAVGQ